MIDRLTLWLLPFLYQWIMNLLMFTCRVEFVGREHIEHLKASGDSWIFTAWHENTAVSVWSERKTGAAMMASDSKDGEYIARGIERMGNLPVRGSASRGGAKAAKAMVKALKSGRPAAITPDGPRGPARKLQSGVLYISAMSDCPIVPYHVVAKREWVLTSWDRHRIPRPFSRVVISIGKPYRVDRQRLKNDESGLLDEVERAMQWNVETAEKALAS